MAENISISIVECAIDPQRRTDLSLTEFRSSLYWRGFRTQRKIVPGRRHDPATGKNKISQQGRGNVNRKLCISLLSIAAFVSAGVTPGRAETLMTRHVREATINGQAKQIGRLPAAQIMQLDVVLPMRDRDGLHAFLADLYSSTVPNYRHFLTPAEFTARFGPTQEHYDAVVKYVQEHGLAVVGGSRDSMEVQVKGPVSAIEAAFHVNLLAYQHPTENRVFYAPDREPTVDLPFALAHFRSGQLLDPASFVCQEEGLRQGARPSSRGRCHPRHDWLGAFGIISGKRYARGLLRRKRADRCRPESGIIRVFGNRSRRPDQVLHQRKADEYRAYHSAFY